MLWLICTAAGYFRSVDLAEDRYDHELINSADSVIARLELVNGKVVVDLPAQALAMLKHGDNKFYYQILTNDFARLSGDVDLPGPEDDLLPHVPKLTYRYDRRAASAPLHDAIFRRRSQRNFGHRRSR